MLQRLSRKYRGLISYGLATLWTPCWSLGFLLTGPHPWWQSLIWITPMAVPVVADFIGWEKPRSRCNPLTPFSANLLLLLLAAFFFINTGLLLYTAQSWQWHSLQTLGDTLAELLAVKFLLGSNATLSGILVAHELIHRPQTYWRLLGRCLLILCCYDHFYTEHIRGHHRRVGQQSDPATARFGETYSTYFRRTLPAQFCNAWRLENRRLRRSSGRRRSWLYHRVWQGIVAQGVLVAIIGFYFGPAALLAFLIQSLMAIRNLEAVNYIQHWGLRRDFGPPAFQHAWQTNAWCSHYMLLGLANHAHHHCQPRRPFYLLKDHRHSPRLPYGYFALMFFIAYRNHAFQKLATDELRRLRLGPFSQISSDPRSESTSPSRADPTLTDRLGADSGKLLEAEL